MQQDLQQVSISLNPEMLKRIETELQQRPYEPDGRKRSLRSVVREWIIKGARINGHTKPAK